MAMVQLIMADAKYKELYRNLFNMYQNELAQYNSSYQWVDDEGYFDKELVDIYFQNDPAIYPMIIKWNGHNVGVVVITKAPLVKDNCDYCIQEFYLIQSCRGKGIAQEVSKQLFKILKGRICLSVLNRNYRAIAYWDKVLSQHATKIQADIKEVNMFYEFTI